MAAAAGDKTLTPGMVTTIQTFGERVNPHPHLHALASRGGWAASGEWIPVPYVDSQVAERLFWHKALRLLRRKELLRRVYEIDPLVCPKCGSQMRVIGFITEPQVILRILDHLRKKTQAKRGPPASTTAVALAPA